MCEFLDSIPAPETTELGMVTHYNPSNPYPEDCGFSVQPRLYSYSLSQKQNTKTHAYNILLFQAYPLLELTFYHFE